MASKGLEKKPLTHRPLSGLRSAEDQALVEMGYAPSPSTPKQNKGGSGDKKNVGKRRPANRATRKKENAVASTTSRASSTKKRATARHITKSGGDKSTLSSLGESALEVAVDDMARPALRGFSYAAGATAGVVVAGNIAAKTGMKVPGFSS
jgi:hypothetical protein